MAARFRARLIDLSSGRVIVAVSYLLTSGLFPVSDGVAMTLCVLLGLAVGGVNSVLIVRARASSMIVTLAVAMILLGTVIALSQFRAPGDAPAFLRDLARQRIGGVPLPVLVWAAVLVPAALLLKRTVYGRTLDAMGANPQAAALSGLPYLRVIFVGHVASALISVLCGFILVGFVGKGSVTLGQDLALNSLAAAILGGCAPSSALHPAKPRPALVTPHWRLPFPLSPSCPAPSRFSCPAMTLACWSATALPAARRACCSSASSSTRPATR